VGWTKRDIVKGFCLFLSLGSSNKNAVHFTAEIEKNQSMERLESSITTQLQLPFSVHLAKHPQENFNFPSIFLKIFSTKLQCDWLIQKSQG